jgi:hypothetical protein
VRPLGTALLGLIGGIFAGLIAAEVIGIVGVLLFDRAIGFRWLPVVTAVLGVALALSRRPRSPR